MFKCNVLYWHGDRTQKALGRKYYQRPAAVPFISVVTHYAWKRSKRSQFLHSFAQQGQPPAKQCTSIRSVNHKNTDKSGSWDYDDDNNIHHAAGNELYVSKRIRRYTGLRDMEKVIGLLLETQESWNVHPRRICVQRRSQPKSIFQNYYEEVAAGRKDFSRPSKTNHSACRKTLWSRSSVTKSRDKNHCGHTIIKETRFVENTALWAPLSLICKPQHITNQC